MVQRKGALEPIAIGFNPKYVVELLTRDVTQDRRSRTPW
jgi:hypothetical protein